MVFKSENNSSVRISKLSRFQDHKQPLQLAILPLHPSAHFIIMLFKSIVTTALLAASVAAAPIEEERRAYYGININVKEAWSL